MTRLLKKILLIFSSFLLLISIVILGVLWTFSNNIPDYKFLKNYKPPVSSKMYSGKGDLVADFSKEKRIFVPYSTIPENVINAFLSAEDKNFFSHPGVDAKGVLRAMINNVRNIVTSRRLEGASERVEGGETGVDRQHVADFVRSLRSSTPHRRNDFSNLGIQVPLTAEEEMSYMVSIFCFRHSLFLVIEGLKFFVCSSGTHVVSLPDS